jgi:hypothetical protein
VRAIWSLLLSPPRLEAIGNLPNTLPVMWFFVLLMLGASIDHNMKEPSVYLLVGLVRTYGVVW